MHCVFFFFLNKRVGPPRIAVDPEPEGAPTKPFCTLRRKSKGR